MFQRSFLPKLCLQRCRNDYKLSGCFQFAALFGFDDFSADGDRGSRTFDFLFQEERAILCLTLKQWKKGLQTDLPSSAYDLWQDRATFHFLASHEYRMKYVNLLGSSLKPGGKVIMATFGPEGPERCSGLPVIRYSPESLLKELGEGFNLAEAFKEVHRTPFGTNQEFIYCFFIRSEKSVLSPFK